MTDAEATVRFCILDGIAQTRVVEEQTECILRGLFYEEPTAWAVQEYLKELDEEKAK